jgi:hypothetical protein
MGEWVVEGCPVFEVDEILAYLLYCCNSYRYIVRMHAFPSLQ